VIDALLSYLSDPVVAIGWACIAVVFVVSWYPWELRRVPREPQAPTTGEAHEAIVGVNDRNEVDRQIERVMNFPRVVVLKPRRKNRSGLPQWTNEVKR
jgi:hypothetical protein